MSKLERAILPIKLTVKAIIGNFTQMNEELHRNAKTGEEYPGDTMRLGESTIDIDYVPPQDGKEGGFACTESFKRIAYLCENRESLNSELIELDNKSYHKIIAPVNDGHDRNGTPLHKIPMESLLKQAIENHSYGISPVMPSPLSGKHEAGNAHAFFAAYKDPEHHQHRYENLAGAIIHGSKGIWEQAIMEFPNEECRIDITDFRS
jgi:hypothetical protein